MKNIKKALAVAMLTATACATVALGISCKKKEESATLRFEGVEGTTISNIETTKGEELTLPVPEKEGFKFEGWYTNPNFEGNPVTSLVVESDGTYYAKWTALCVITLDVNGGSLSTTKIYAEAGANVYDKVKDLVPTKAGLTFGAWFYNGNKLTKNVYVPAEGITLKAEYMVEYTVEIYMDKLEGEGYEKSEENTFIASDYVGKSVTLDLDVSGCTQVSVNEEVLSATLSENAADNVFKAYFNRNTYAITFNPNYPDGTVGEKVTIEAKYGAEIPVPSDLTKYVREGYCMLGWSLSATSKDVVYAADLDALLYNAGESTDKGYTIKVERPTMVYGVWQKGMTDAFGGNDYIYYVEGMGETIYLSRGNVFFKGEYDEEKQEFFFFDENGVLILDGRLLGNGKYLYSNSDRQFASSLYEAGKGLNNNVKLRVDDQNGITYTVYDEETSAKISESTGTYERITATEYLATFTETNGQAVTTTMYFMIGSVDGNSAFQVRNEEEFGAGTFVFAGIMENTFGDYTLGYRQDVTIEFDGFGTATWTQDGSTSYYNYKKLEDGSYRLTDSNENEFGCIRLSRDMDLHTQGKCFFIYNKALDVTITLEDGATLTMDGVASAVYKKNGNTISSYYQTVNLPMGGTVVSIKDRNNDYTEYKFLVKFSSEDGTVDSAKLVLSSYEEFYYKDENSLYYAPLIVLDEEEAGKASVYGYTSDRTYLKVMEGTYEQLEDGTYRFTKIGDGENYDYIQESPINLRGITTFIFQLGSQSGYSVHYWYSFNDTTMEGNLDYTNGEATLKLVGGFAYYKATANKNAVIGAYTKSGDVISFTDGKKYYYFELNEELKTFSVLEYAPYTAYLLESNNTTNVNYTLEFDGKGGATYVVKVGEGVTTETYGTIQATGKTLLDKDVYTFTASENGETFEYVLWKSGSSTFYLKKDTTYVAGEYISTQSEMDGIFTLDGYCYEAKYVDGSLVYEGKYYVVDGVVYFQTQGQTYVLDPVAGGGKQFTLRGEEYGKYALISNQYASGLYFELNGYGKLTVYTMADGVLVEEASDIAYTKNGYVYTFTYNNKTYVGEYDGLAYTAEDGKTYKVLSEKTSDTSRVLIDVEDWAVLILDEFGGAVKYDWMGQKQTGRYTRITDNLVYFVNSQGTDACLYDCDMGTGAASPIDLENKSYYTADLKALNFTKYGFVIINGDTENMKFYQMEGKNVIIYRRPVDDSETVNDYGFVRDDSFGALNDEEKTIGGDTYYRGSSYITFNREENNLAKYPIYVSGQKWTIESLTFTPIGSAEFRASGELTATVETKDENNNATTKKVKQSCVVVREGDDMYILLGGVFRLHISASFAGKDATSTFTATDLSFKQDLYSYRYLDIYYRLYAMYGASSANSFTNTLGMITLEMNFGEDGKENQEEGNFVTATFGENTELFDRQGNKLEKINHVRCYALDSGMYYVDAMMPDGELYRLYFYMQAHSVIGATGYVIYAFTHVQEFNVTDAVNGDYTVVVERTLASETGAELGSVFAIELKNGTASLGKKCLVDNTDFYAIDGVYRYVDRRDGKATYYYVELTENNDGSTGVDGKITYATFATAVVTARADAVIMREAADSERFVEIIDGRVEQLNLHGNIYYVEECEYDAATQTYTVTTTKGTGYTIKVEGQNVVIS